ncbi:alkaline phosphatase [Massilia sp. YMA4]|uniref:alkaline phosphatase D family protein n=1 Tax=Massilia sp. YMA4 TaxID=1593482 RepID=UPI000DD1883D|nr:alkaline phosphatase D family protein [Massilia sp. YMA4]AXA94130.1 phosphodiesterase [Massilia sp. YMA4]
MDRRQFLRLGGFLTVSVATGGLAGCGSNDYDDPDSGGLPPASGAAWSFPQSVASGDPRPDSIVLWTRAVPPAADPAAPAPNGSDVTLRLLVTSGDNARLLGSNAALAGTPVADQRLPLRAQYDNTVRHKLTGLQPGQTYYYQFVAGDVRSNVGRFRTAPASGASVDQLRFATLTCQDWSVNHWGALEHVATEDNLDFILHLGDYVYETVGEDFQQGQVETRHDALRLPDGTPTGAGGTARYATTLADYRYLYKKYRSDRRLQAVHERYAFVAIWDDHEFSDDCWQDAQTYDASLAGGSGLRQTQRRRDASQAWFEFMPADVTFDAAQAGFDNIRIYRQFDFGTLARLVMTDQRLYRADHVIPESAQVGRIGSRYLVPQDLYERAEAQKLAAGGSDPLAPVSMLGATQRGWWQQAMTEARTTWKLWGNEVSLLRMGLSGTDAIATLLALQAVPVLAASIGSTAQATAGNVPLAAAIVAASTAGASAIVAQAGAQAIAAVVAADGGSAQQVAAGVAAGLTTPQATLAATAYMGALSASGGPTASAAVAAHAIAFGYVKPDVQAKKVESPFVTASGKAAALAPYFRRFLLNCDQWDGYNAERKALMRHLKDNRIGNVVALTGDIHAFFAGTVSDDFDAAGGGTPVMVDLVTAGASSESFFSYLRDAAAGLGDLATIVSYPVTIPVPDVGSVSVSVNLLDYTLGKAAPTTAALLEQIRVRLRSALAAKGVPEARLDATTQAVLDSLAGSTDFGVTLLNLAGQLSALNSNPWLRHVNTDAQGYTLVTVTPASLTARFRQVNRLAGSVAPAGTLARETVVTVTSGSVAVTVE